MDPTRTATAPLAVLGAPVLCPGLGGTASA